MKRTKSSTYKSNDNAQSKILTEKKRLRGCLKILFLGLFIFFLYKIYGIYSINKAQYNNALSINSVKCYNTYLDNQSIFNFIYEKGIIEKRNHLLKELNTLRPNNTPKKIKIEIPGEEYFLFNQNKYTIPFKDLIESLSHYYAGFDICESSDNDYDILIKLNYEYNFIGGKYVPRSESGGIKMDNNTVIYNHETIGKGVVFTGNVSASFESFGFIKYDLSSKYDYKLPEQLPFNNFDINSIIISIENNIPIFFQLLLDITNSNILNEILKDKYVRSVKGKESTFYQDKYDGDIWLYEYNTDTIFKIKKYFKYPPSKYHLKK
jgi:hypothetical protein